MPDIDVRLFKFPNKLDKAFQTKTPKVIGFANYSWNFDLSYSFAQAIKRLYPDVVIVFGGPNYGLQTEEIEKFWNTYRDIDFSVVKEGEVAFSRLFNKLREFDFDPKALKMENINLTNVHYFSKDGLVIGSEEPRLDLSSIPSPYLMGLMDDFFVDGLAPMVHTTRGCPFKCSFCTEGAAYYNRVDHRFDELQMEMEYISKRVGSVRDLYVTDANFGMFKQDLPKGCLECQKKFGYPENVYVSTGKNQKERVVSRIRLNRPISLTASLQSTDPEV